MRHRRPAPANPSRGMLTGLAAGAAGLIMSTAAQMAEPLLRRRPGPEHIVALAGFIAIGILRLDFPQVLLVLVPLSIALAWRRPPTRTQMQTQNESLQ